jgi:hypothetical protein
MRRSTVLSLSLQLVFLGNSNITDKPPSSHLNGVCEPTLKSLRNEQLHGPHSHSLHCLHDVQMEPKGWSVCHRQAFPA